MAIGKLIGVYGTGGLGREVIPFVRANAIAENGDVARIVFIDDNRTEEMISGHEVLTLEQFCAREAGRHEAVLAVGDGALRERLAAKCRDVGVMLPRSIAANATIFDNVELGEGAVLCPNSMITSDVKVGKLFQANIYAYVAHDCIIGDCVTLAAAAKVNGNVHIADGVRIGSGAILQHGLPDRPLTIGEDAIVGIGAIVTQDVPAGATVIGAAPHLIN